MSTIRKVLKDWNQGGIYHGKREEIYFELKNILSKKVGITKNKREIPIIVSLTTFPKRLHIVHLSIESIMRQSMKADKIILWLSREEIKENKIPKKLKRLQKRGLIINFVEENLRSYKKLFYTLKDYKESLIITIDDDTIYPSWFIKTIYKKYKIYPTCIIGYRCSHMVKEDNFSLKPYLSWPQTKMGKPSFNTFSTGVGGILYPPNSLNKEVFNKGLLLKKCPLGDDIWFKAMGLLNNTKTAQVFNNSRLFHIISKSQKDSLWKHNNGLQNRNDIQLKAVFDHYGLYKKIE